MERVTTFLLIFSTNIAIQSLPIENGFSVKFNPTSAKEDLKSKKFGALFAKVPQDFKRSAQIRREVLTKIYFPEKLPAGYSNQVAKLMFPSQYSYDSNNSWTWSNYNRVNILNLPVVRQPYDDYKILVATAPPNVHLGGDNKQTIIYVVFPEDGSGEPSTNNVPSIYFVNEKNVKISGRAKKTHVDPILIVDSNRTITGLKSNEISKFVRFKNKWTSNAYRYNVTR